MKKLIALLLAVSAVPTFAQQDKPKQATVKQPRVQQLDFGSGELIEGTLATGDLDDIYGAPKRPDFERLIRVRMNFNDKLRESVHEL